MSLPPDVQEYFQEVLRLLYLNPAEKRYAAKELAVKLEEAASARGLAGVRETYGEPRRLAAETMLNLAESGRRPWKWQSYGRITPGFEYKSKAAFYGWPLVHIATGYNFETGEPRVARGVIAIGTIAIGGLAIGGLSLGLIGIGGITLGLLGALGGITLGGLCGFGGIVVAVGYAFGSVAVAGRAALGAVAVAPAAAGAAAIGRDVLVEGASKAEFSAWLARNMAFLKDLIHF